MIDSPKLKICLFHPWLKSRGGAEAVVLAFLKNTRHQVNVYTWAYDMEHTFPEFKNYNIQVLAPPFAKSLSRLFVLRSLLLFFSKLPAEEYDVLLLSTSGMAEAILLRNKPKQVVTYCHTILRAANPEDVRWNSEWKYSNPFTRCLYKLAVKIYNVIERKSWKKMDTIIFNSELSQQRAEQKGLLNEADKCPLVVNPPIKLDRFSQVKSRPRVKNGGYFFYPSRFHKPKRQDLLIDAWSVFQAKHPDEVLIMAGSTENQKYFELLKKKARGLNIIFKPNVSDKEMIELYANCRAGLFVPFVEDWGIVPFEFMALQKPLIAVDRGGYMKIVENYPWFFKIIERIDPSLMTIEINNSLEQFLVLEYLISHRKEYKAPVLSERDFAKKLDEIIAKRITK